MPGVCQVGMRLLVAVVQAIFFEDCAIEDFKIEQVFEILPHDLFDYFADVVHRIHVATHRLAPLGNGGEWGATRS